MGAGTSAEEFFLKSINVESIFEFVERTDYLFLYSIKECVEKSDCHEGVYLSEEEITRFEECLDRIRKNLEEWQKS